MGGNGSPIDPADYAGIVGSGFVKRERQAVLAIGNLQWNRWSLGRLGCPHPMAAANLNRVIQSMKITTLQDLADRAHEIGSYQGIGVTAYWTILAILREQGFDVATVHGEDVSYHAVKAREMRTHQAPKRKNGKAKA
jgi:hypothetical protein